MIYILNKSDNAFIGRYDSLKLAKESLAKRGINEDDCTFTEDIGVEYVSRIVMVDGEWVYKNKTWWTTVAPELIVDYSNHKVYDILQVAKPEEERECTSFDRFLRELYYNADQISKIDGRPGQITYNMQAGKEFISLFREECILTDFKKDSNTSPMIIFNKLSTVIAMVDIGGFREARQYLQAYKSQLLDDFLTSDRIDKYIAMLTAADSIEYATDEDYFYTVPTTEESTDEELTEPGDHND